MPVSHGKRHHETTACSRSRRGPNAICTYCELKSTTPRYPLILQTLQTTSRDFSCVCFTLLDATWYHFVSTFNSLSQRSAAFAKATKSFSSGRFTVANAHVALASPCVSDSLIHRSADLAKAMKSFSSGRVTVANAHEVLVKSCALHSLARRFAALAKARKSFSSDRFAVANAHAMLAKFCELN